MRRTTVIAFVAILAAATAMVALAAPPPPPSPEGQAAPPPAPAAQSAGAPAEPAAPPAGTTVGRRPGTRTLKMGAVGRDVRFVETRLAGLRPGRIDGRFDRRLKVAVSRFQRMRRLRADGVVGRKTWRALGVRPARSTPPTSGGDAASNELLGPPLERFPVAGRYQRTRNFGEQRSDHRHEGEDLLSATGTPVVAVDDARIVDVARSGDNGGRGLHVDIRRADGTEFRYYHLSVVAAGVVKGAVVDAGRRLGAVGSTGRSSASHLHFEVHVLREGHRLLVNPAPFLDEVARRNKDAPPETSAPPGPPPPPDAR